MVSAQGAAPQAGGSTGTSSSQLTGASQMTGGQPTAWQPGEGPQPQAEQRGFMGSLEDRFQDLLRDQSAQGGQQRSGQQVDQDKKSDEQK